MDVPLLEPYYVPDTFCSGLARVEQLSNGMVRLIFYSEVIGAHGAIERHVVCKMIRHVSTLGSSYPKIVAAITGRVMLADEAVSH